MLDDGFPLWEYNMVYMAEEISYLKSHPLHDNYLFFNIKPRHHDQSNFGIGWLESKSHIPIFFSFLFMEYIFLFSVLLYIIASCRFLPICPVGRHTYLFSFHQ